jgi:hypothetical protein
MDDFDLSSFDTFDVQQRRMELANQPVSEELLEARANTERMVKQYNAMNLFLGAMGKRTGAPMSMPTYADNSASAQKQAGQQVNREFLQSLTRLQEQIGRPLTMDEIPAIAKAFNVGPSQLAVIKDYFPYIGISRKEQRERRKESSDLNVAAAYDDVMQTHRGLIANAGPETVANRIEEAIADINSRDDLSAEEKQAASDQLFEDFKNIASLNKESRSEIRAIEKAEDEALQQARLTGQNVTVAQYMDKAIERINRGESWEQVNRDTIKDANDIISNKEAMASLQSQLKAIKPEDKRTAALKSFEEKQGKLTAEGNRIKNIEEVIQMEIDSRSQNPLMYDFTGPMNEAMAIENVFYNLKIANPEAINEDLFRAEFAKFKAAIQKLEPEQQKAEIMKAMKNASERLQLPVRLLLYVAYGKKGYENLLKEGRT